MTRISKVALLLSTLFVFVLSCQKEEINNNDNAFPINLTGNQIGRAVQLNWDETKVSSFEEYIVVRSDQPIPADFEPTPFSNLVVANIDEFEENSFRDDSPLLAEVIYYQIYADVGDRFLKSNEIVIEYEITLLNIAPSVVEFNPDSDQLFIFDASTREIMSYNYKSKEVTGTNSP